MVARCAAHARAGVRRPRGRLRLRSAAHPASRRVEQGRPVLALRDDRSRCRVEARLGHRRQRLDLRRAPLGLRRGRPSLRARPLAAVSDGAARTARRLRAGRARVGEADAVERDRVPAQGAHVRALLADRAAREDAAPARSASTGSRSSRTGCCATARGSSTSCCSRRRSHWSRRGGCTTSCSPRSSPCSRWPALGIGIARYYVLVSLATLVALWNYLRRGVPATWELAEGPR